jgi:pimeloyl-ACP methyl ester carboxylesterase
MTERAFPALDQPAILSILFHPRRNAEVPADGPAGKTVRFAMDDGTEIGGRLHAAAPDAPAVLFFHGNGEIATDYDSLAPVYRGLGLTLLVVDYRGYGISQGRPTVAHLMTDAVAVYRKTRSLPGLAPSKWFVMGRSMGSVAALEVARAAGSEIAGLILDSGIAETAPLLKTLGGVELPNFDEARDGVGNPEKIRSVRVPTLILHGTDDRLVPVANARTLHANSGAADKRLVLIERAGHNDLLSVGPGQYFQALHAFVGAR